MTCWLGCIQNMNGPQLRLVLSYAVQSAKLWDCIGLSKPTLFSK